MTISPSSLQNPSPVRFARAATVLIRNKFVALTPNADEVTQFPIDPANPPPVVGIATQDAVSVGSQSPIGLPGGIYPVRAAASINQGDSVGFDSNYFAVPGSDPAALGVVATALTSVVVPAPPGEDDLVLVLLSGPGASASSLPTIQVYNYDSVATLPAFALVSSPDPVPAVFPVGSIPCEEYVFGTRILGVLTADVPPDSVGTAIALSSSNFVLMRLSPSLPSGPIYAGEPLYGSNNNPGTVEPFFVSQNPTIEGVGYVVQERSFPGELVLVSASRWQRPTGAPSP